MTRILLLSDIHANAPALDAVLTAESDIETVFFLGDAVDIGPHPNTVCDRLRALRPVAAVHGNHDRTVLAADAPADAPAAQWQHWSHCQLSEPNRAFLADLPRTTTATCDDTTFRLHHGDFQPPDAHDGAWQTRITPEADPVVFEAVADRYPEDVILHGHSHYPFTETVAGTTFVNPGSVGLQREGWPADHARYTVVDDGTVDLRTATYELDPVAADSQAAESPHTDHWTRTVGGAE